jgi:predicted O-methyltransferase YrrM
MEPLAMKRLENILFRRPRALNILHQLHLVQATSQTVEDELKILELYAAERRLGLEIGSHQGVSAVRIAAAMASDSTLYCVDPWPSAAGQINPCQAIFERHVRRAGLEKRIRVFRFTSAEIAHLVPNDLDFAFVDGDHSWSGIETDWQLVRAKIKIGGVICLHDSFVPPSEPWRQPDSVRFFEQVIATDDNFEMIERIHSLGVIRRKAR